MSQPAVQAATSYLDSSALVKRYLVETGTPPRSWPPRTAGPLSVARPPGSPQYLRLGQVLARPDHAVRAGAEPGRVAWGREGYDRRHPHPRTVSSPRGALGTLAGQY
jgi:hypothetical protein